MRLKKDSTAQKLRGAYYTPLRLANAMVGLFDAETFGNILEPSCGDGVFLDSLAANGILRRAESVTAIEIEMGESEKARARYGASANVNILCDDFFDFYQRSHQSERYDLILGNPPYIRYQYLTEKQRELQSMILTTHGMKANKLINSWVCFLVACIQMLSDNGRIAFVIPAEILQVAYAEDLRLFLSNQLARITLITFEQLVFPEIEQEVVVFIGEKGGVERGIRIIEMTDIDGFKTLDLGNNGYQKLQHAREKWTKYFISANETALIQNLREDKRFARFKDFGIINIGITTGNNDYFSVTSEIEGQYSLDSVTLPLIGRSSHAHGIYFTPDDWNANVASGKKAMLVRFPDILFDEYPQKHKEYIALGERMEQNKGYKCGIRDRWYIVPSVWVPDAFFLRRNNLYPKFVLNYCGAVSTDTMHRMKFRDGVDAKNILLSYYNSVSFAFSEICGRSYGGGVLEILPGEMGNILIPIVNEIDVALRDDLLGQIDGIIRRGDDVELALDLVDGKLLIDMLGIEAEICQQCRNIWKKLQARRLKRNGSDSLP
ncbi:MAG: class I SAM-dependent methyltransferase [Peptococcaceae bacterium]|jgi:adenine-specific DNA-methyltransferase|nr:class I SAM-dependent methyltransferase [Peptococcaceae bacterium]